MKSRHSFTTVLLSLFLASFLSADEATCDVLVIGGGSAGVPAAVQSAKAGAKTILLEITGQLGGTMTTGGVPYPGLFHAWGKQVIAGIGWELVEKTVTLNDGTLPDFQVPTGRSHWKHQIRLNAPLFALLAEETCLEAGVEIRYFETPMHIERKGDLYSVRTSAYGENRAITCRQLVDCTGNASVVALLGHQRLREETRQPGSFYYMLDTGITAAMFKEKKAEYTARYQKALADGKLQPGDLRWGLERFLVQGGDLGNYVEKADSSTAALRTDTNMRGRASLLRALRFARSLPGGEKTKLLSMAPEVGVRETWRIQAEYMISKDDYVNGTIFPDAVCYAFYPIDVHDHRRGVQPAHLREGVVATVPLRAMIPAGSTNLLVAGRCLGSDREANSALRVQATCMASGQAAGAVAALAAQTRTTPGKVDPAALRKLLREHGAIVPTTDTEPIVEKNAETKAVEVLYPTAPGVRWITDPTIKAVAEPAMKWADDSKRRTKDGKPVPCSKDPTVVKFKGRYLMYFSLPPDERAKKPYGWIIGIAESPDLIHWKTVAELPPMQTCDAKGLCAPCARVWGGKVHLFYQTYGNGKEDAICYASSENGVDFTPHPENPIFRPSGDYTCGRAIDADAFLFQGRLFLYVATRDPAMKIQKIVVAVADPDSDLGPKCWTQPVDHAILEPELSWETRCIEASTVCQRGEELLMFYAGGYNNDPQQIGVARSRDGIHWTRLWSVPFLPNGPEGSWNSSESGHPGVFVDDDGRTFLFYQGNPDKGRSWYLSQVEIGWKDRLPFVISKPSADPVPPLK